MGARKSEVVSVSVPPGMKDELRQIAEQQGMGASELFRDMVRLYKRYQEEREFRRLQRYGATKVHELGIESEEALLDVLDADR